MSRDEDREEEQVGPGRSNAWHDRDDLFDEWDGEGEFDDSDRDSDFAPVYDEEEIAGEEPDCSDPPPVGHEPAGSVTGRFTAWDEPAPEDDEPEPTWEPVEDRREPEFGEDEPEAEDDWPEPEDDELVFEDDELEPAEEDPEPETPWEPAAAAFPGVGTIEEPDAAADWSDEEDYYEEEEEDAPVTLPLGLILVGVVALLLLASGGYGVMQQRAATQEEIRQLRAELARAASPGEVAQTRATNQALVSRNEELESRLEFLERENRTLQATVGGLEKQLQAQQDALSKQVSAPKPAPAPAAPRPAPKPVKRSPGPVQPATTTSQPGPAVASGSWFVNFGSYGQRATAQDWADRLQPGAGDVVVTSGEKDGRTYYRVRVVNLASRDEADAAARSLEQKYDLARLWVGQAE